MPLHEFLKEPTNLHAREELFNYRLLFDLKTAAAAHGYHLLTYYSDVDHDRFDVIFDDRDLLRKVQLKTAVKESTQSWEIHQGILRPTLFDWEELGFCILGPIAECPAGVGGGVVLMEYEVKGSAIEVIYSFTDIFVISAISLGLLKRPGTTKAAADALRAKLSKKGPSTDKLGVAKGLFVRAETPAHLLAVLGLRSPHSKSWQSGVKALASEEWGPKGRMLPEILDNFRNHEFLDSLKVACGHADP